MSSPSAQGIGRFFGHRPPVTSSIRAEDSRSSCEDILPPGAAHVSINSTTKLSDTLFFPTTVPNFLFLVTAAVGGVFPGVTAVRQAIQLEDPIQPVIGPADIPAPQTLRLRHVPPHDPRRAVLRFTHECGGISAMQIQCEGRTSHQHPATGGHLARAYFSQRPPTRQGPYPIPDKFLNEVAPATHAGHAPKGPLVFIPLRYLKLRIRRVIM
jgi:hypothetical protein